LYPTSYIKTEGTTVTRAADTSTSTAITRARDVARIDGTNFSSWFNENAGTFLIDSDIIGTDNLDYLLHASDGTETGNAIRLQYVTNQVNARLTRSGIDTFNAPTGQNLAPGRLALAYQEDDVNYAAGGTTGTADTSALLPRTIKQLNIAEGPGGTRPLSAHIKRLSYYPERLAETVLGTITT
jgi:hypothetical protein